MRLREDVLSLEAEAGTPTALKALASDNLAIGEELLRASALTESLDRRSRESLQATRDALEVIAMERRDQRHTS